MKKQYVIFNPQTNGYIELHSNKKELNSCITDAEHAPKFDTKSEVYWIKETFKEYWEKRKLELHEIVYTSKQISF